MTKKIEDKFGTLIKNLPKVSSFALDIGPGDGVWPNTTNEKNWHVHTYVCTKV